MTDATVRLSATPICRTFSQILVYRGLNAKSRSRTVAQSQPHRAAIDEADSGSTENNVWSTTLGMHPPFAASG
jgi:hypothetical protein